MLSRIAPEPTDDRVARIIELEASAAGHDKKADAGQRAVDADRRAADADRWAAAELIAAELGTGKSQRQLGREIGKSHTHVRIMAQTWRAYGGKQLSTGESFNAFYRSASRTDPRASRQGQPGRPPATLKSQKEEAGAVLHQLDKVIRLLVAEGQDPAVRDAFERATRSRLRLMGRLLDGLDPEGDPDYGKWEASYIVARGKNPAKIRSTKPRKGYERPAAPVVPIRREVGVA